MAAKPDSAAVSSDEMKLTCESAETRGKSIVGELGGKIRARRHATFISDKAKTIEIYLTIGQQCNAGDVRHRLGGGRHDLVGQGAESRELKDGSEKRVNLNGQMKGVERTELAIVTKEFSSGRNSTEN